MSNKQNDNYVELLQENSQYTPIIELLNSLKEDLEECERYEIMGMDFNHQVHLYLHRINSDLQDAGHWINAIRRELKI